MHSEYCLGLLWQQIELRDVQRDERQAKVNLRGSKRQLTCSQLCIDVIDAFLKERVYDNMSDHLHQPNRHLHVIYLVTILSDYSTLSVCAEVRLVTLRSPCMLNRDICY